MRNLLHAPPLADEEAARKAALLMSLLRAMLVVAGIAMIVALFNPQASPLVTLAFYLPIGGGLLAVAGVVRAGHVRAAGWLVALFFWSIIAIVTLLFGGLQGQNAGTFCVAVLLMGVIVGGREALALALVSTAWCALVGWLEMEGRLPEQLGVYSTQSAWTALFVTLVLTSVLLQMALGSLERAHAAAQASALARDEALRRSIQAQKLELVGTLAAGVAHDLNNLLAVMGSASGSLRDRGAPASEHEEALADLDAATARATLLSRQLMAFGRPTDESLVEVDLSALARGVGAMLPRLLGRSVTLQLEVEEGCRVHATRSGLEQIVLNLAVNARDALQASGTFRLLVRRADEQVELVAADDGVGMDEATKARIFEPFFTTKQAGTGLGLATVRELVARYGGTLSLQSAPKQGTSFTLRFPAARPSGG